MRFLKTTILAAATLAMTTAMPVSAQNAAEFPTKSMTYILPFNAGGESDISARFQQAHWKEVTGQDVVVQYQPGGGGAQAWSQLNGIAGDGYTIMGVNLPHIILQPMASEVGYKTDDLVPVHMFHYTPDALLVAKDSPYETLADLVEYAKANPGMTTFAGSAVNSANHVAQVTFDGLAGIQSTYIPFSGTGTATPALLGGQTVGYWGYSTVLASQGDQVRMLAVATEERMPAFPDVPTFKELGYDLVSGAYRGVGVPASTPEELRTRVSDIIEEINQNPDFRKQMEDAAFVLTDITYDKMGDFMAKQKAAYEGAAEVLGIGK